MLLQLMDYRHSFAYHFIAVPVAKLSSFCVMHCKCLSQKLWCCCTSNRYHTETLVLASRFGLHGYVPELMLLQLMHFTACYVCCIPFLWLFQLRIRLLLAAWQKTVQKRLISAHCTIYCYYYCFVLTLSQPFGVDL
jgi:hypothetical protein